jgi:CRP-like cAMP-binding protein
VELTLGRAIHPSPLTRNRLLAALPPEDLAQLWPGLERVELAARQVLQEPDEPITAVYFIETGYVSQLVPMDDGSSPEVGMVGAEGMVSWTLLHGGDRDGFKLMMPVPGTALRMDAEAFRKALKSIPALRAVLHRSIMAHFEQVTRTAACNARHSVKQRLARWLLMTHDRVQQNNFLMTHELLSRILGVRRPGITIAAGMLQKAGLIQYKPGIMVIRDRRGLESVACECYGITRRLYGRSRGGQQASPPVRPLSLRCGSPVQQ